MSDPGDTNALRGEVLPVAIFAAIALTMPLWFPWIGGYSGLDTKILIFVIFVLGFDLLLGFTGYLSFGHAAFFGTSAYTTGLTLLHFSAEIIPAMLMSVLVTFVLALLIGLLLTKRTGIYFAILTLAFASMLYRAALSIFSDWTGGDNGLTGLPTPVLFGQPLHDTPMFLLVAAFAILGFWIALRIARSPFGLMLRAIKSNQERLAYTGVDVSLYKLWGFIVSGLYGGVAGSLMVIYEPYVATHFLHWTMSGEVVIMAVIGGVGTLIGPMIGAGFMMYFENVASAWIGEQWLLVLGLLFVLIMMYMPGGFMEGGRRLRAWFRHRRGIADAPTPEENDTHG
ncbi:branched-chain amino acid ABC transporter permease [Halofilum ochraceum]|uniref:branched-chain amino acid ABC transporter permease n=1 Tax=Halofilum ochraceum TaxID=1611323 RepID=UPI00082ABD20|nr:branched-chain amino acid ABC transporter permease [Halofilum ochraceum]